MLEGKRRVTLVPALRDERTSTVPPRPRALAQAFESAARLAGVPAGFF